MNEFRTTRRVEFADTDMAGIVHFARFYVFMETAEHEFLRAAGSPGVHFDHEGMRIGWPRLAASCEFKSPARCGDVLDIRVRIQRKGNRALTFGFEFKIGDRHVADGEISVVCCALSGGHGEPTGLKPVPIPAFLASNLEEYPAP